MNLDSIHYEEKARVERRNIKLLLSASKAFKNMFSSLAITVNCSHIHSHFFLCWSSVCSVAIAISMAFLWWGSLLHPSLIKCAYSFCPWFSLLLLKTLISFQVFYFIFGIFLFLRRVRPQFAVAGYLYSTLFSFCVLNNFFFLLAKLQFLSVRRTNRFWAEFNSIVNIHGNKKKIAYWKQYIDKDRVGKKTIAIALENVVHNAAREERESASKRSKVDKKRLMA